MAEGMPLAREAHSRVVVKEGTDTLIANVADLLILRSDFFTTAS